MRVLLVSLGTGPSVEHGIAYSLRTHRPDRVVYFATDQSVPTKDKVEALISDLALTSEIVKLSDGDDPNEIYRQACDLLNKLGGEGVKLTEDVFVDFTSGTKAMSAGLFAAALAYDVHHLIYVSGRRGSDGRVISGTERAISFSPSEIFADRLRRQIVTLFNARLFGAALRLIEQGLREIHMPGHRQALEDLRKLCLAYRAWDWFDHPHAAQHFDKIDKDVIARWGEQIGNNKGWVVQIAKGLQTDAPIAGRYSEKLLLDLWLNAERRMEEGHWVDAVARLYRLTELIAQFRLARSYGLDTGALDVASLPESVRLEYEQRRDESGRVRLGLKEAYELLAKLNDPLGQSYSELQGVLQARNDSIGGHGLLPVTEDNCRKLAERVRGLLKVIPNWEEKTQQGRFPIL